MWLETMSVNGRGGGGDGKKRKENEMKVIDPEGKLFSGRVGNMVYCVRNGKTYVRRMAERLVTCYGCSLKPIIKEY